VRSVHRPRLVKGSACAFLFGQAGSWSQLGTSAVQAAFAEAERQMEALSTTRQQKAAALDSLQLAQHALQLMESRVESSAAHVMQAHVDSLEQQLLEARAKESMAVARKKELEEKAEACLLCCATACDCWRGTRSQQGSALSKVICRSQSAFWSEEVFCHSTRHAAP
jgi:hypothetical protein